MRDGSDAIADWPILNALLNASSGATWVSVHHGGGVGIGYSLHAGMVIVADGTREADEKLQRVLTCDPGIGVVRHADAGYPEAIATAERSGVRIPMREFGRARPDRRESPFGDDVPAPLDRPRIDVRRSGEDRPPHSRAARRLRQRAARRLLRRLPATSAATAASTSTSSGRRRRRNGSSPRADSLRRRFVVAGAGAARGLTARGVRRDAGVPRRRAPRRRAGRPRSCSTRSSSSGRSRASRACGACCATCSRRSRARQPLRARRRATSTRAERAAARRARRASRSSRRCRRCAQTEVSRCWRRRPSQGAGRRGRRGPTATASPRLVATRWPTAGRRTRAPRRRAGRDARGRAAVDPMAALAVAARAGRPRLCTQCAFGYELRLHRARGYGALKAILEILAEEEPLTLTEISLRLRRTPGSTKDYLSWLEDVDLVAVAPEALQLRRSAAAAVGPAPLPPARRRPRRPRREVQRTRVAWLPEHAARSRAVRGSTAADDATGAAEHHRK